MYNWVASDPCQRWPMLFFLAGMGAGIVLIFIALDSYSKGYFASGIAALIICIFGAYHFKELMALKEQVDSYNQLNSRLRQSNNELHNQVNQLDAATTELLNSKESLSHCNQQNEQNLKKFENLQSNLAVMGENSVVRF